MEQAEQATQTFGKIRSILHSNDKNYVTPIQNLKDKENDMARETVTGSNGTEYEVRDDGTLHEIPSSSGGILGALIDSAENLVSTAVDIITPK